MSTDMFSGLAVGVIFVLILGLVFAIGSCSQEQKIVHQCITMHSFEASKNLQHEEERGVYSCKKVEEGK